MMETEVVELVVAVAVIAGTVEAFKFAHLPSRLAPLVSLILGVVIALLGFIEGGIMMGFVAGLSASGLYSGGKASIVEPIQEYRDKE
jgi:hypothetical protein